MPGGVKTLSTGSTRGTCFTQVVTTVSFIGAQGVVAEASITTGLSSFVTVSTTWETVTTGVGGCLPMFTFRTGSKFVNTGIIFGWIDPLFWFGLLTFGTGSVS